MLRKVLTGLALVMMMAAPRFANQESAHGPSHQSFGFRPGQAVYVAALRRNVGHGHGIVVSTVDFNHDLDVESRIRKEVESRGVFKIVEKPSEAEFVFLVHVDTSAAEGLVLPPEMYRRYKDNAIDFDALREAAYGRYLVGPYKIPTLGKISNRLVKKFHEEVQRGGTSKP